MGKKKDARFWQGAKFVHWGQSKNSVILPGLEICLCLGNRITERDEQLIDGIDIELDNIVANAQMSHGKVVVVDAVNGHIEYFEVISTNKQAGACLLLRYQDSNLN